MPKMKCTGCSREFRTWDGLIWHWQQTGHDQEDGVW